MFRTLVKLAIAALVIHALYQFVPVYVRHHQFRDDVKQAVLFGTRASETELVEQVMVHAANRGVPLDRKDVSVQRISSQTFIRAAYEQPVRLLPGYVYPWQFSVSESAVHMGGLR